MAKEAHTSLSEQGSGSLLRRGTALELRALFIGYRFKQDTEAMLHEAIAQCMVLSKIKFRHEVRMNKKDRPDFLVGDVAIEVKIDGSLSDLTRQASRYAQLDEIKEVLIITTRARHVEMPHQINGKPLVVCWIGGNAL